MPADTYAEFYNHPWLNVAESRKLGRQVYEDKVYVEIKIKGDSNTSFSRMMKDEDKTQFPTAWSRFKGGELEDTGTALKFLPNMSPASEKNLNAQGIMSIEDLAGLQDNVVIGVQGMVSLRKSAQAYIAAQDADLMEEVKDLVKPKRKRRKRNPKTGQLE